MQVAQPVEKTLCGAKTRTGSTCAKTAGWGTDHHGTGRCRLHGGASPNAQLAGVVILARREASTMGIPVDIAPHEAILECIRIAAGEVAYCSQRISELDPDDAWGQTVLTTVRPLKYEKGAESSTEMVEETRTESPQLHIWIVARRQAMDRLVQYSAAALKAGVEERQVRVAEQVGGRLAEAIDAILRELGVRDHPKAPEVVGRNLRLLSGGAA